MDTRVTLILGYVAAYQICCDPLFDHRSRPDSQPVFEGRSTKSAARGIITILDRVEAFSMFLEKTKGAGRTEGPIGAPRYTTGLKVTSHIYRF